MSDDQAVKDLLEAQQAQARDREGEYQDIREARERSIGKAVSSLIQIIGDLGPCFAVSVAYTIPGPVRGEANTHLLSGWNTNEIGSAHLAQASDLCNEKHVEIQKHLDKANLEKGANDGGHSETGEVRKPDGGEAGPGGAAPAGEDADGPGEDEDRGTTH